MNYVSLFLHNWKITVYALIVIMVLCVASYFGYILKQNEKLKIEINSIIKKNEIQQNITKNISLQISESNHNQKMIYDKKNNAIKSIQNIDINKINKIINCEFNNFNNLEHVC